MLIEMFSNLNTETENSGFVCFSYEDWQPK